MEFSNTRINELYAAKMAQDQAQANTGAREDAPAQTNDGPAATPAASTPAPANAYENKVFAWEAPEFIKHEKGTLWFLIAGIFTVILVIYAVMSNSWTFAVAILITAGVYFLYHHVEPKNIIVTISEMGIKFDSIEYPFNEISTFWFIYKPPHVKNLHIRLKQKFKQDIVIPLEEQDPAPLHTFLSNKIPEWSDKQESFSETLIRTFKL